MSPGDAPPPGPAFDGPAPFWVKVARTSAAGFLLAHLAAYAAVNIFLGLGLLALLLAPEGRRALRAPWPGHVGKVLAALVAWILVSQLLSPETWAEGARLSPRFSLKPVLAMLLGVGVARVAPGGVRRWLAVTTAVVCVWILPVLPTYRLPDGRIGMLRSVYAKEVLGPNPLGGVVALLALFLAARLLGEPPPGRRRALGWAGVAFLVLVVVLTGSRCSMAMLGLGTAALAWWRAPRRRTLAGLAVGGLLAGGAILAVNPRFLPGYWSGATASFEFQLRFSYWRRAAELIARHPWVGCGARRYRDTAEAYFEPYGVAWADGRPLPAGHPGAVTVWKQPDELHNDYLTMLAMHGVPALLLYLLLHVALLQVAWRQGGGAGSARSWLAAGAAAAVLGTLGYSTMNGVWFNKELGPFLYFLVAAALADPWQTAQDP